MSKIEKLHSKENKIIINFDSKFQVTKKFNFLTTVSLQGELIYRQDEKSFYFHKLNILKMNMKNIPEKFHGRLSKFVEFIAQSYLERFPVYKIKDKNLKLKLARALLKNIKVENKKMYIKLGF